MDETTTQRSGPSMGGAVLGELAQALAKAQAEIKPPKKGRTAKVNTKDGGSYSYAYADLADVIECYRKPLSEHGIALTQTMRQDNGHLVLVTTLIHSSGQWVSSEYPIRPYDRPQEQGSAITYARRYSVTALLGIAAEDDDDGKAAQDAEPVKRDEPTSAEDAAILMHAAAIADLHPDKTAEDVIEAASKFTGKDGKVVKGFRDPRKVKPGKWKSMTKANLEKWMHEANMAAEPGAEEAAELLT